MKKIAKQITLVTLTAILGACSALHKDITGTYQGTLPCADCEKIQAKLILGSDNTYQYNTIYFKNGEEHPFVDKGKYTWDKNKSDVIHLQQEAGSFVFKITDSYAEMCDSNGNPSTSGNNYKLSKVK